MKIIEVACYEYKENGYKTYVILVKGDKRQSIIKIFDYGKEDRSIEFDFSMYDSVKCIKKYEELDIRIMEVIEYIGRKDNIKFGKIYLYADFMNINGNKVLYGEMDNMCELVYGNMAKGVMDKIHSLQK